MTIDLRCPSGAIQSELFEQVGCRGADLRHVKSALRDRYRLLPRQEIPDRLSFNRRINVYASGIITGSSAHTDTTRDMWKAPADIKASQGGVLQPIELTILQNIILDWIGINATSLSIKARISHIL